ncbi:MAG TPA: hypothetical protein VEA38_10075 [Terriglobales bacterium]|nr:hypothetical protein [Terriglobales bacterium]
MPDVTSIFEAFRRLPEWLQRGWLVWWLAGFVLFFLTVRLAESAPEPITLTPEARGRITHPLSGAWVPRQVLIRGSLDVPVGEHAYIAVRDGDRLWPKGARLGVSRGAWEAEIVERSDPRDGMFSVVLFAVNETGRARLDAWLAQGHTTVTGPGLQPTELAGFRELDQVSVQLIPGTPQLRG